MNGHWQNTYYGIFQGLINLYVITIPKRYDSAIPYV